MRALIIAILIFASGITIAQQKREHTRYILIEAPCKAGFNALPNFEEEVILSKVFKAEFEDAFQMVNAEPQLIIDFEVALENEFPNSRNQIKDILVYMLTSEKEAKELHARKIKQFKLLEVGVVELKIR